MSWTPSDYSVPTIEAMESVTALVQWLIDHPDLNIPPRWNNIRHTPDTYELGWHMTWDEKGHASRLHTPSPGIIFHSVYVRPRHDGWFQALYSWLRLQHFDGGGMSAEDAYDRAQEIAASDDFRDVNGNRFVMLEWHEEDE